MRDYPKALGLRWKITYVIILLLTISAVLIGLALKYNWDFTIFAVIIVLICGALGYFLVGFLISPLNDVADSTEAMLEGDFSKEIYNRSHDEIGDLADIFNTLREKLDENFSEITTAKRQMEILLTQMADGMIAVDQRCRIITANEAARRILRMSDDDAIHKKYDDIILRFTDALTLDAIREHLKEGITGERFSYGGETYDVRYDYYWDDATGDKGAIIVLRDITDRLKMDNMQTDFVANVSHELKTPLTSIKGYTETLLNGGIADEEMALDFLSIINSETDRMNRLVKDILQLSRLDTGQQKWDFTETDLAALVRIALKKIEVQAKKKSQLINAIFNPELSVFIEIDRDKIEQVVLNILSNSVKYTREKGRIDVDILCTERDVKVIVLDNGMGIPEKELSRVFERFFMVNRARTGQAVGTGLGLAISKQIVEGHNGNISIESIFGKGTKVTISLPFPRFKVKRNIL